MARRTSCSIRLLIAGVSVLVLGGTSFWIGRELGWLPVTFRSGTVSPNVPDDPPLSALLAAEREWQLGNREEVCELLEAIPTDPDQPDSVQAAAVAGNLRLELGQARAAEANFRRALESGSEDIDVRRRLGFLLTVEGRRWEAAPHLLYLLQQDANTLEELILLGDVWSDYELPEELARLRSSVPEDPLPLLGEVRLQIRRHDSDQVLEPLARVISAYPQLPAPYAWLGLALLERSATEQEFLDWKESLPESTDAHPMIWYVRGLWAERLGQKTAAARCWWESVRLDSNFEPALFQMSRILLELEMPELARGFEERARQQYALISNLRQVHNYRDRLGQMPGGIATLLELAETCQRMGRTWEALGWYRQYLKLDPVDPEVRAEAERLAAAVDPDAPQTVPGANPARRHDLSTLELPDLVRRQTESAPPSAGGGSAIRFREDQETAGIDFHYFNGVPQPGLQTRLLETTGGGIGVLDFDLDGWPDLYFPQGAHWPPSANSPVDQLFRNLGTGKFEKVTAAAELGDPLYSQGVSVGDVNSDGFPDIWLGNVGQNRLYLNQGDGTFQVAPQAAKLVGAAWTTSTMVADLNGDAHPDLVEINYVGGRALEQSCGPLPCPPTIFPGLPDRLYLNSGDGTFQDVSAQVGWSELQGKGLGVVAADLDGSGRLSLLVANDGTPNFYFRNETAPGDSPVLVEAGLVSGLAVDHFGKSQACMGIAVEDLDGDGQLEIFVTNFYDELNTLYRAEAPGYVYADRTRDFGLGGIASKRKLGFGTEALDADLDGWPDLVVVNGHVQDLRSTRQTPYRMQPQVFRNLEGKSFREEPAEALGSYFSKQLLGRGLARLDWNRDGREDFVVTHLDAPVALLTNESDTERRSLGVELRGVTTNRDAVGATIDLRASGRLYRRQMVAGDGYLVSNERRLIFAIPDGQEEVELVVTWLGGGQQAVSGLQPGKNWLIVEGHEQPIER